MHKFGLTMDDSDRTFSQISNQLEFNNINNDKLVLLVMILTACTAVHVHVCDHGLPKCECEVAGN